MKRISWKKIDPQIITDYCIDYKERWNDEPSIRDIFYAFMGRLWHGTHSSYKGLIRYLKKHRYAGTIDWRLIRDGGGRQKLDYHGEFKTPKEYIEFIIETVEKFKDAYRLPFWEKQPKRVVLLIEKNADIPPIASICKKIRVSVAYLRGYSGVRNWFEMQEDFNKLEGVNEVIVLAVTDCDPSGEDIARVIGESLEGLEIKPKLTVEKLLLTVDQVRQYNIPNAPSSPSEIAKMKRDPRYKTWPFELFRAETAAFRVLHPDAFEDTVVQGIVKYIDRDLAKMMAIKHKFMEKELNEKMDDLIQDMNVRFADLKFDKY